MRIRATVAYDGTDYQGFQRQANGPTVQEELERALERISQEQIRIQAAGRTDSGVHAEGQVIAFNVEWRHALSDLHRAMNAVLPPDIAICGLDLAAQDFHPRYSALGRHYRYTIYKAPVRSPLVRRTSLHMRQRLNVPAMEEATRLIMGEHDFATFGRPPQGDVTVRRVKQAGWRACAPWLFFDVEANAFLYRMVRSLVGTLLWVGKGRLTPDEFGEILSLRDRSRAGPTAPAHGLSLIEVKY